MQLIRDYAACPPSSRHAVIALGNFDGVHRGHQKVIAEAQRVALSTGKPLGVMCFEPHPRRFFQPDAPPFLVTRLRDKAILLRDLGVNAMFVLRFNKALSGMSAETFVEQVLVNSLEASHIVTGPDFTFGHARGGDVALLSRMGNALGFGQTAVPPLMVGDAVCSSSRIRAALAAGEIPEANHLLGRPYFITGHVQTGDARGRDLGYPTANLAIPKLFPPKLGIYAVRLHCEDKIYDGAASLGTRPTFDGKGILLEVHCLDASPNLYGKRVKVEFFARLRDELKFDSVDMLIKQMAEDVREVRRILKTVIPAVRRCGFRWHDITRERISRLPPAQSGSRQRG